MLLTALRSAQDAVIASAEMHLATPKPHRGRKVAHRLDGMPDGDEIDVTDWVNLGEEQMGEAGKPWLEEPGSMDKWLFKPVRMQDDPLGQFPQGGDWAEKVASDVAALIGLPAARVVLARRGGEVGALSRDITSGGKLTLGNELLWAQDSSYPTKQVGRVPEYTLERILEALARVDVQPFPCPDAPGQTAQTLFAGYLVLDALIANQDRHHGNWGIIENPSRADPPVLAPSFDHGSSLGFQLRDEKKSAILTEDKLGQWVDRGLCRPMAGRPHLVWLAKAAVLRADGRAAHWLERLAEVADSELETIVSMVPGPRMSHPSRRFCKAVLIANRRRLVDGT